MKWTVHDRMSCGLAFPRFCFKGSLCIFLKKTLLISTKSKNDTNFLLNIMFKRRLRISATEQRKTRESSKHTILLSFFHLNIQKNPLILCAFPSYFVSLKHSLGLNVKKKHTLNLLTHF